MPTGDPDRETRPADDVEIVPDRSHDDSDVGWGYVSDKRSVRSLDDQRLLDERPPHWD